MGQGSGVLKDPLEHPVAEGLVHLRRHQITVVVVEAEAVVGIGNVGLLAEQIHIGDDHVGHHVGKVGEQTLVIVVKIQKVFYAEYGCTHGHGAADAGEGAGATAGELVHRFAAFIPVLGQDPIPECLGVGNQGGNLVQFLL